MAISSWARIPARAVWCHSRVIGALLLLTLTVSSTGCLDPCGTCSSNAAITFTPGMTLISPRAGHSATLLPTQNEVLIVGGTGGTVVRNSTEIYSPLTGSFIFGPAMHEARAGHTATRLMSGDILIVGGYNTEVTDTAEIYQVSLQTFIDAGRMATPRSGHTASLLGDGSVLITGGSPRVSDFFTNQGALINVERYEPNFGFQTGHPMITARSEHTATVLMDGSVLIAGGFDSKGRTLDSAELYDPTSGTFSSIAAMRHSRRGHSAILVPDGSGRVLITGGWDANRNPVKTTEIYDFSRGFTDSSPMNVARAYHSSSLLGGSLVLIAGGDPMNSAEVFANGEFIEINTSDLSAGSANAAATMPNEEVLVTGGGMPVDKTVGFLTSTSAANLFLADGSGLLSVNGMKQSRSGHTASPLSDGTVFIAGGATVGGRPNFDELYDVALDKVSVIPQGLGLVGQTATTLVDDRQTITGVLIAGGSISSSIAPTENDCQALPAGTTYPGENIFDPAQSQAGYTNTRGLTIPRYMHTATRLKTGDILVTGGIDRVGDTLDVAELYNPTSRIWTVVNDKMKFARHSHAAALLCDGTVLIAGGCGSDNGRLASAEIYDPIMKTFSATHNMTSARAHFTLTDLQDTCAPQRVLAAGGSGNLSAELYKVDDGTFMKTGAMIDVLFGATATRLNNGKVLITSGGSANAEVYNPDPTPGTFSSAGGMNVDRIEDTATLLMDGRVLVTGGFVNESKVTTSTTESFSGPPPATPTPTP